MKQSDQKLDIWQVLEDKVKKQYKERTKRHVTNKRKVLGSFKLFHCDRCNITLCTNRIGENVFCEDCNREMHRIFYPTFTLM